ncbi:MAG: PfkB family carbohydrate kinase [Planctomycetota bacterium]
MKRNTKTTICGGGVFDLDVKLNRPLAHGKQEGEFSERLGGGVVNLAEQLQNFGQFVQPTIYVGHDPLGRLLSESAEEIFPHGMTWPILESTRRSVILGSATVTSRPRITALDIPPGIADRIASADRLVIAPDHPQNAAFIESLLALNAKSFLQLSKLQAAHASTTRLAAKAACVAINADELSTWSGRPKLEIDEQIAIVRERGVQDLIVTHARGVAAWIGNEFFSEAGFEVRHVLRTSSAGDKFLATYLAYIDDEGPAVALRRGLAAAALFVEGTSSHDNPAVIERVCQERARVVPAVRETATSPLRRMMTMLGGLFA